MLLPLVQRTGLSVRASIEAVTLLAQAGELAVIVALVGLELGHIDEATLGAVVAVVVVTSAVAPWLSSHGVVWRLTRWYPSPVRASLERAPRDHVLLLGCGETGAALLAGLSRGSVVVVDGDPAVVQSLVARGVEAIRGNGADPTVLREAGAHEASAIVSTMRRPEDNTRLLSEVPGQVVFVRVFSEDEATRIRALGGRPVIEAELAAEALVEWVAAGAPSHPAPEVRG